MANNDMRLYAIGTYAGSTSGFDTNYLEYANSTGNGGIEFTVINDWNAADGEYYVGVINSNAHTSGYKIEEDTSERLTVGTTASFTKTNNIIDAYEFYISSAGDYVFTLENTAGDVDYGLSFFDDETEFAQQSEAMDTVNATGDGGNETLYVSITDAGYHCLVVWKNSYSDYSKSSSYNIISGMCGMPSVPSGFTPADGATGVSVDIGVLDWDDSTNAKYYEVWVNVDGEGFVMQGETETSDWPIGTLQYNTEYSVAIKAVNICGYYTWNTVPYWSFTTEPEPVIKLTAPYTTETRYIGELMKIRWSSVNISGNVAVQISRTGGTLWENIASSTANDGVYDWTISGSASSRCLIRIRSIDDSSVVSNLSPVFAIAEPFLAVTSPNGGEVLSRGSDFSIKWLHGGSGSTVNIDISRDYGLSWDSIVSSTSSDGSYIWTVTGPESDYCLIRVESSSHSDQSDAVFSIYCSLQGDLTADCSVDLDDLEVYCMNYLLSGVGITGDINSDNNVDLIDYAIIATEWYITNP